MGGLGHNGTKSGRLSSLNLTDSVIISLSRKSRLLQTKILSTLQSRIIPRQWVDKSVFPTHLVLEMGWGCEFDEDIILTVKNIPWRVGYENTFFLFQTIQEIPFPEGQVPGRTFSQNWKR